MAFPSDGIYQTLGVAPIEGRLPKPEERDSVVLISDRLWQTWFNRDKSIIGKSYFISGTMRQVVGVMPADFRFPSDNTLVWVPGEPNIQQVQPGNLGAPIVARMKPGVTTQQLAEELTRISKSLPERFGGAAPYQRFIQQHRALVDPLLDRLVGPTVSASDRKSVV